MVEGFLTRKVVLTWSPVKKGHATLAFKGVDRVVHAPFMCRGLSLNLHNFVHGLLRFYGCQLHHITPNGVLHIANFITLCECFLGIEPHFELWRYFFLVKV